MYMLWMHISENFALNELSTRKTFLMQLTKQTSPKQKMCLPLSHL